MRRRGSPMGGDGPVDGVAICRIVRGGRTGFREIYEFAKLDEKMLVISAFVAAGF